MVEKKDKYGQRDKENRTKSDEFKKIFFIHIFFFYPLDFL